MASVGVVGRPKGHRMGMTWHHWAALAGGCPQIGPRGAQAQKSGPEMGRAKRYAQCVFVDMSALKRNMFGHVRRIVYNVREATPNCANIKLLKFIGNLYEN